MTLAPSPYAVPTMNDQTTLRTNLPSRSGRAVVILVDCLREGEGGAFVPGSEGLFLLRLGALLASGSGGRVIVFKVLPVREGESMSAMSTTAQQMRQRL